MKVITILAIIAMALLGAWAQPPPVNEDPCNAIGVGFSKDVQFNNLFASLNNTNATIGATDLHPTPNNTIWYLFTAPSACTVDISVTSSTNQVYLVLWELTDKKPKKFCKNGTANPESLDLVAESDAAIMTNTPSIVGVQLEAGVTYYLEISSEADVEASVGVFVIDVTDCPCSYYICFNLGKFLLCSPWNVLLAIGVAIGLPFGVRNILEDRTKGCMVYADMQVFTIIAVGLFCLYEQMIYTWGLGYLNDSAMLVHILAFLFVGLTGLTLIWAFAVDEFGYNDRRRSRRVALGHSYVALAGVHITAILVWIETPLYGVEIAQWLDVGLFLVAWIIFFINAFRRNRGNSMALGLLAAAFLFYFAAIIPIVIEPSFCERGFLPFSLWTVFIIFFSAATGTLSQYFFDREPPRDDEVNDDDSSSSSSDDE